MVPYHPEYRAVMPEIRPIERLSIGRQKWRQGCEIVCKTGFTDMLKRLLSNSQKRLLAQVLHRFRDYYPTNRLKLFTQIGLCCSIN